MNSKQTKLLAGKLHLLAGQEVPAGTTAKNHVAKVRKQGEVRLHGV